MNNTLKIFLIIFGIILAVGIYSGTRPGKYDSFAQCLADSGIKMYSAWWCGHCQDQKADFGKSFNIIKQAGSHVECSPGNSKTISEFCREQGVEATPSWITKEGKVLRGRQSFEILSLETNCSIQ